MTDLRDFLIPVRRERPSRTTPTRRAFPAGSKMARFVLSSRSGMGAIHLLVGVATAASGCLVPPDADRQLTVNAPPRIDYDAMRPPQPVTAVSPTCADFSVSVAARDDDSPYLSFRWVANNGTSERLHIQDDPPRNARTAGGKIARVRVDLRTVPAHFFVQRGAEFGVLSLFVTDGVEETADDDAPRTRWRVPDPSIYDAEEVTNLGEIEDNENGPAFNVVEIRWAFHFVEDAGCGT
ncbi:MAG: hypothetical protein IPK13_17910 [Deltaproteobacteria bacterium]|nr:hypothetical protein [Deltaproteobacteria bacterium]